MQIKPIKVEYFLEVSGHKLKGSCVHKGGAREVTFFFDNTQVAQKLIPDDSLLKDDDVICDIVEEYCRNQIGTYADLFRNHVDRVRMTAKSIEVMLEYYGIEVFAGVTIEKTRYIVKLSTNNDKDRMVGTFEANSFSDVLEKLRLFTSALDGVAGELTSHINEISNDQVESRIKWRED